MRPQKKNSFIRALLVRLLKYLQESDSDQELEVELVTSNTEETYEIAERALRRLDAQLQANKVIREEARQLRAYAQSITKMLAD